MSICLLLKTHYYVLRPYKYSYRFSDDFIADRSQLIRSDFLYIEAMFSDKSLFPRQTKFLHIGEILYDLVIALTGLRQIRKL